ncbi:putative rnd superfamily protein [Klebsiella grimontii]|uniref:Putative rnd superfamily protein n=1 Tax=Klebsiella grimontii TaxID=2058152 RepID=A0A7H4P3W2_9ENTR|nr:putative rnd superfamily protein [Klebsiella grimontii]
MPAVGRNVGMAFAELKHWDLRPGEKNSAQAIISRANQYFNKNARQANISVMSPPTVRGLGQSSGFELWLQDSAGKWAALRLCRRKPPCSMLPEKIPLWTRYELIVWKKSAAAGQRRQTKSAGSGPGSG